jgi:oligopeptide transport system substrate-binding protein
VRVGCALRLGAVTIVAVILAAAGCSRSPDSHAAATATVMLVRGGGAEPDSLDPQRARSMEAQQVLRDLCEGLTTLDKRAEAAPGVATDWNVSADGKTYTFSLRHNARWSNGEPVVAADFVAGLRRLVDPATASTYAEVIDVVVNAADIVAGKKPPDSLGVQAPSEFSVVIQLASPAAYLPGLLSHPSTCPIHRATLTQHPADIARPGMMVSNGAFALKDWVQGSHILLTRNRYYWNDAATRIDAVKYLLIPDENAELTRYRAGEMHITNVVPRAQFDWIRANVADQLHIAPELNTYFFGFNLNRAPFKDQPGLRRALSLVIDRDTLVQRVLRVGELAAYGWVPPGVSNYTSQSVDYRSSPMPERIAEARRLYAAAGYSADHPLHFELRYNAGEVHSKVAVAVASMWKDSLGVDVQLTAVEFKSLLQDIDRGDVEVFRSSWLGDYNDAYTFAQYFKSNFGVNLPHYQSAEYDSLVAAAAEAVDLAKRRDLLEGAERVLLRDHPVIPLYFYVTKHLVKPEVRGWYDNVMNVVYSRDLSLSSH